MSLHFINHYTREQIRAHPKTLVVFGDNVARVGYGGQAAAARDEPNAVGIPTLWSPRQFFAPGDFDLARKYIDDGFRQLERHLRNGGDVWWPSAGIGTGLARLPDHAPVIYGYIEGWVAALRARYERA